MDRDELERQYRAILDNPGTGARITEAKLRAIGELQRLDDALDVPDGSPLTPRQRAALRDAIYWGFSPVLVGRRTARRRARAGPVVRR